MCTITDQCSGVILVVDDSPESLGLVNDTLEQAGYDVLVALEGRQALAIAERIRPDLVLMDAIMPHKDGFDTCQEMRALPEFASVPVIFMTGLSDSEHVVRGLEVGGVDYLTKPVRPDELLARIKVHLSNARLTTSAFSALDHAGQYLLSVNSEGTILWATPQVYALFARAGVSESQRQLDVAAQIRDWLSLQPKPGQNFELNLETAPLENNSEGDQSLAVSLLQAPVEQEILLKLMIVSKSSGEDVLRARLKLTKRESQVLFWISNGKTNWEIGQILKMSPRTVNKHLEQIFPKLGVQNRTAAARIAISTLNEG